MRDICRHVWIKEARNRNKKDRLQKRAKRGRVGTLLLITGTRRGSKALGGGRGLTLVREGENRHWREMY